MFNQINTEVSLVALGNTFSVIKVSFFQIILTKMKFLPLFFYIQNAKNITRNLFFNNSESHKVGSGKNCWFGSDRYFDLSGIYPAFVFLYSD